MIRIILIRHGRTAWNVGEEQGRDAAAGSLGKRFRGLVDLPLADEGAVQAEITAQRLARVPLAAVYCSPLRRAVRTAQVIATPHGLTPRAVAGLRTMDYGDWAGLLDTEVAQRWPTLYQQWLRDPFSVQVPSGESAAHLRGRAFGAVHDILSRHSEGDTVALVSHQAVIKTLVCGLAQLPTAGYWQVRQGLCNLSQFDYEPARKEFSIVGFNDTCHLNKQLPVAGREGTRILLIRHGQTAWNAGAGEERFRGRTDLPLDKVGQGQASALAERLQPEKISAVYASPLLRARQTILPLADRLGLPLRTDDSLVDIDYGRFQSLTHKEAALAYPNLYRQWRASPSRVRFPGGEGLLDVQGRLRALLASLTTHYPAQTVALVGHQIVNKVLCCTLLGLDLDRIWRVQQDTCAIDVFQEVEDLWHVLCLNDTCHLG